MGDGPQGARLGDQEADGDSIVGSRPQFVSTIASIAGLWIAADVGYYFLLPLLGQQANYNDGPIGIALYYVFWVGVTIIAFWPIYATWPRYATWATFENRLASIVVWTLAFAGSVAFAAYLLPALPPFNWREGLTPPELPLATAWYFLPKSAEILFQQLLIVALVLVLSALRCSLPRISIWCAALFGGAHVLLAFGDVPWGYVARFSVLAAMFGLAFPFLILRVPNGFAYSYITHWAYYAVSVMMARAVGSGAIANFWRQLVGGS